MITLYVNKNTFERVPATLRKVPKEGIKACIKPLADMFKKLYCHDWEPQEKQKVFKAVRFFISFATCDEKDVYILESFIDLCLFDDHGITVCDVIGYAFHEYAFADVFLICLSIPVVILRI